MTTNNHERSRPTTNEFTLIKRGPRPEGLQSVAHAHRGREAKKRHARTRKKRAQKRKRQGNHPAQLADIEPIRGFPLLYDPF